MPRGRTVSNTPVVTSEFKNCVGDKARSRQSGKRKSPVPLAVFEQPIDPRNFVDGGFPDFRKAIHQLLDLFAIMAPQAILVIDDLVGQVAQQAGNVGNVILRKAVLRSAPAAGREDPAYSMKK